MISDPCISGVNYPSLIYAMNHELWTIDPSLNGGLWTIDHLCTTFPTAAEYRPKKRIFAPLLSEAEKTVNQ